MRLIPKTIIFLIILYFLPDVFGCTVLTATNENTTLVGNNEDMFHARSKVEFHSAADGKYGRVFFGMGRNLHQGGMNEKGLFFDCVATGPPEKVLPKTKPDCPGGLLDKILEDCATIPEVIKLFDKYDSTYMNSYMTMIVDASGDWFVSQAGIIDRKKEMTAAIGRGWQTAYRRLQKAPEISVELFRSIVSEVHVEGVVKTLYSNVYDLKNQIIYLYYYYDFENPLRIDLHDYLKKNGTCSFYLGDLFPERDAQVKKNFQIVSQRLWKSAVAKDTIKFDRYVGTYIGQGIDIDITQEDERYEIRFLGTEPYELVPLSASIFTVVDTSGSDSRIKFVKEGLLTGRFKLEADLDGWKFTADRKSK